ncbi:24153_t:CDS:1, partial [Gigaspora rosea]
SAGSQLHKLYYATDQAHHRGLSILVHSCDLHLHHCVIGDG